MTDDREPPGAEAHQAAVAWAAEHDLDVPCYKPWDLLTDAERELFARMASAAGVRAVHDAGLVNTRRDAQLLAFAAERDRVVRELKRRADRAVPGVVRDAWEAAVDVVLGGEGQERSDEKEPR